MARELEIEDFDELNLKSCCPYHAEDTPSFIYNPKNHTFHCFGCQKTVDLIDVYMQKGSTYIQAVSKLFEVAKIQYSFGEANVKTRYQYQYPHEEPLNDREQAYAYLAKRKISRETADYADVRQDTKGNLVFNYYDSNDVLTMVKYRPSHKIDKSSKEPKCWCQPGADTTPLLFNMNRINVEKPLLITEGECFKGDVEVLTPRGWVRLDEYNGESVLQLNHRFHGEFISPLAYIKKYYEGDIYTLEKGGNFSLSTTANHNWVYVDYKGETVKRKISDFPHSLGSGYIPAVGYVDGKGINLTNAEIALYIAISADGTIDERINSSFNYCRISFLKQRKIKRFEELVKKCGYQYTKTIQPSNPDMVFFGVKIPKFYNKELPFEWVHLATLTQRNFILNELVHWDGNYVNNRNQIEYASKLKHNADVVQALAHTSGYMSTIMKRQNRFGKWYKVSILFGERGVSYQDGITKIESYKGFVYCVSVPSGILLVRQNGHIGVCGNCDVLAAIEAGYSNAVSVPLGAGNFQWIEENWEWLDQFQTIIICADNDEPGLKMQKECVYRLGSWRTKIVDIPQTVTTADGKTVRVKDLNEILFYCGKDTVMQMIHNAKDSPIESLVDFSDVTDIDMSDVDGIYTGIEPLDHELMRMFYGSVTLLTGTPGSGKSSILYQFIGESIEQDKPVWLFSKEMPVHMSKNWMTSILAGQRHIKTYQTEKGAVYYRVTNEAKSKIDTCYRGKIFLYRDGWSNDVEDIKISMTDSARKNGSKLFVLDNLMTINLHASDDNKYDRQTELLTWLIDFATRYNVCVILVAHPRKKQDINLALTKYDISGSSNMINLAHRSLGLRRVTDKEKEGIPNKSGMGWYKEPVPYDVILTVIKDRLRGREGKEIGLFYDRVSRRFFTNPSEFNRQYAWDTATYSEPLPYPIVDHTEEVYGAIL